MQTALDLAAAHLRAAGARRIHRLRLRVGELSGVVPEALRFAFEALSAGGPAEGAVLEIERVAAVHQCAACGAEFTPRDELPECPRCGGWGGRPRSGLELELTSLEIS